VLEGLLSGNVNWLRPSSSDGGLTARLLQKLLECDPSGQLAGYVAVLPTTTGQIGQLCRHANGVSAWGGETALQAIRLQIPPGCRWIDWGHRISFAYLTPDAASPAVLDAIVDEVCRLDQQACSSPQWLLVDSDDERIERYRGATGCRVRASQRALAGAHPDARRSLTNHHQYGDGAAGAEFCRADRPGLEYAALAGDLEP
jgi:phenylacetate-CoA ligase